MNIQNDTIANLFVGASKVMHGINPEIIDSKDNKIKSINCGYNGFSYVDQYIIINHLINNNYVKNIFIEVDPITFLSFNFSKYNCYVNSYLPFLKETDLQTILEQKRIFYYWNYVPFYRYLDFKSEIDSYLSSIVIDYKSNNGYLKEKENTYHSGHILYEMEKMVKDGELLKEKGIYRTKISQKQLFFLNKIVDICIKNHATLFFISMPVHPNFNKISSKINGYNESKEISKQIAIKHKLPIIDNSFLYNDSDYFMDDLHLNENGAKKYSQYLNGFINNLNKN